MIIAAATVHTGRGTSGPGWVRVEDDLVAEVGQGPPPEPAKEFDVLMPGFVDMHCHGGGGAAFTDGAAAADTVLQAHLAHGTTSVMASLVTDTVGRLETQIAALAPLVADGSLLGVHLEGPWLSPRQRGAHDPSRLAEPEPDPVRRLGRSPVRMVTLAPELSGAPEAIAALTQQGVVVALGHTDATSAQTVSGYDAGATVATHLFNGMRPFHHREPGPIWASLQHAPFLELIADGVHLHPGLLADVLTRYPERAVLITDAMAAAACTDGTYRLGPLSVTVVDGRATVSGSDRIAGSSLTMDAAVRHAVLAAGVPADVAVRAATVNPATALGLTDRGELAPGRRADVVALDAGLRVARVMSAGRWVPSPVP